MSAPAHSDLLFDLLRWDGPRARAADLSPAQWAAVADLAADQQVAPLLFHRVGAEALRDHAPAPVAEGLAGRYRANAVRTMRIYGDLAQIVALAEARAIPLVALKGVALAAPLYGNIALRALGDIDLLAPAARAAELGAALADAGYRPIGAAGLGAQLAQHLPTLARDGGACPVEIHWRLSTPEDHYALPVEEIWGEREPLALPGCRVDGMAPEALLLYLSVHATYHHELIGVGARPLCDIAQLLAARGAELRWPALLARAGRWRCERGLALALRLAHDLLGAAVPADALAACGAAGLPEALLAAARAQLFTRYADGRAMPAELARLGQGAGPAEAAAAVWRRVFVSREALATQFGLDPADRRLPLYYGARLAALLRRHGASAAALAGGDEAARARATRRALIGGWLAGE